MKGIHNSRCTGLITVLLAATLFSATSVMAAELFINGDFSGAGVSPWTVTQGAVTLNTTSGSPFTNVYPDNGRCLQVVDANTGWSLVAPFVQVSSGTVVFNYDFTMSDVKWPNGVYAILAVQKTDSVANVIQAKMAGWISSFYLLDGQSELDSGVGLESGAWYNVQMTINVDTWKYSGQVTKWGGATATWSDRSLESAPGGIGDIWLTSYWPQEETICYDNFSVKTAEAVVEPANLTATVELADYSAGAGKVGVVVDLLSGGVVAKTYKVFADDAGKIAIAAPVGTYDVAVKGTSSLRAVARNVTIASGTITDIGFVSLINGDIDGDNEVTSTDLSILGLNLGLTGEE